MNATKFLFCCVRFLPHNGFLPPPCELDLLQTPFRRIFVSRISHLVFNVNLLIGVLMDKIQNHHVKKALSWLAGVASETLLIAAGAAVISGLWYLGFVIKIF